MPTPEEIAVADAAQQAADEKHALFCKKIGIVHYVVAELGWWNRNFNISAGKPVEPPTQHTATPLEAMKGSYYEEILSAYDNHSRQYWLVASVVNILYLAQIAIGATATALGAIGASGKASQARTTAITILTAVGTIVAGVLAFLKSRGQPNRARQFRNDLRKVCDQVRYLEMELSTPQCSKTVEQALQEIHGAFHPNPDKYDLRSVRDLLLKMAKVLVCMLPWMVVSFFSLPKRYGKVIKAEIQDIDGRTLSWNPTGWFAALSLLVYVLAKPRISVQERIDPDTVQRWRKNLWFPFLDKTPEQVRLHPICAACRKKLHLEHVQ